jgi:hypothetical protein
MHRNFGIEILVGEHSVIDEGVPRGALERTEKQM